MPLTKSGKKVMASMRKTYGDKAKNVFYATANKMNMKGKWEGPKPRAKCAMNCTRMPKMGEPGTCKSFINQGEWDHV